MKKFIFVHILYMSMLCRTYAQSSLEISLTDTQNEVISSQTLSVRNDAIGFSKTLQSNEQGKVQLQGLSDAGLYQIQVEKSTFFQGFIESNVKLISGKTTHISLVLVSVSAELGEVEIKNSANLYLNGSDAEVASELSNAEIKELPVEGRDISRVLYRLPNISLATGFFPEAPNVSINGANALYTNYQIDGMDNNENFLGGQRFAIPVGFVQNITALTNNFNAEYGLTSNGIINVTTPSGDNEQKGEVFYTVRPGSLTDASSPFAQRDLSGNQVKDGFQRHQFGFTIGGAVKKDQTFYFINFEQTLDTKDNLLDVPQLGINETVRGQNSFTYLSTKIDHHWLSRWRSSLRINQGLVGIERQGGGLIGGNTFPSAGNKQVRNSTNIVLKNILTLNRFIGEFNYQWSQFNWNYAKPKHRQSDVFIIDPNGAPLAFIGSPRFVFDESEKFNQIQIKGTWQTKSHMLKLGLQQRFSTFNLFGGGNPAGSYAVRLNPNQLSDLQGRNLGSNFQPTDLPPDVLVLDYGVEIHPASFAKNQSVYSIYLDDQWFINAKLNLNLGLRYDYDNLSKGGGLRGDKNNVAPRISLNYSPASNWSFRTGWGIYFDKIVYAVYSDALQFNSRKQGYLKQLSVLQSMDLIDSDASLNRITNNGNVVASLPGVEYLKGPVAGEFTVEDPVFQNELRILNPNGYQNPYSHQFMIGIQRKISPNLLLYVDAVLNRSYNLFRLRNLNAPAPFTSSATDFKKVRSESEADLTRPIPIHTDVTGSYALIDNQKVYDVAKNVIVSESEGRSRYKALNLTLQKNRGTDTYAYRLSYTLSELKNNTEDINFRAMDANDFASEWGFSVNDRTHLINFSYTFYPLKGLNLTLANLMQSGQPINRIPDTYLYGTADLNGDGRSYGDAYQGNSDRQPGEARNSDRLPWAYTFDLQVAYDWKITKEKRMSFSVQVFNVFNVDNLSGYANNATQSNQIQVGPANTTLLKRNAAPPRQFQFSLQYFFNK